MISKKLAIEVLNEMLANGGDYAEIFYENSNSATVTVENNKVSSSSTSVSCGVGLRILKENRSVYGYTSDLTKKGLMDLAKSLNKSFNSERILTVTSLTKIKGKNRNVISKSYDDIPLEEKIALVKEGTNEIESIKDQRIVRYIGNFGNMLKTGGAEKIGAAIGGGKAGAFAAKALGGFGKGLGVVSKFLGGPFVQAILLAIDGLKKIGEVMNDWKDATADMYKHQTKQEQLQYELAKQQML